MKSPENSRGLRRKWKRKNSRSGTGAFIISILNLAVLPPTIIFALITPLRAIRSERPGESFIALLATFLPIFGAILSSIGVTVGMLMLLKSSDRKSFNYTGLWLNGLLLLIYVILSILMILVAFSRIPFA